jgi:squalene-associated FAD-dependent desaturase
VKRVVVIGGGLAGIAAALDCAREHAEVTLLESRGRLGGAAYSFVRDGIVADNGQHVFLRCCTAYRDLLARVGASELVELQPRLAIPVLAPGGRIARLRRSNMPAPLHLARSLMRYPFLTLAQRASLARAMTALREVDPNDPEADARSFGDWLSEHGQGEDAVEALWDLIARPTLNLMTKDASLAQAAYVFQKGLLADPAAGDVGYARVPLGEIHDVAARRALAEARVDVRLRAGAVEIVPEDGGFRVEVSGVPTLCADAVIVAVPHHRAGRLLPPGSGVDCSRLARLGTSPIVNLHVVYDRQVLDFSFAAGVRSPVQWVFDRTRSAGITNGAQYLAVSLSAADKELDMTGEELRERFLPALAELLPAAREAHVDTFIVTREHAATFRAAPGARQLRPGPQTKIPGLTLAGAWTDTGWPATMEGAVRSGQAAARGALKALAAARTSEPRTAVPV